MTDQPAAADFQTAPDRAADPTLDIVRQMVEEDRRTAARAEPADPAGDAPPPVRDARRRWRVWSLVLTRRAGRRPALRWGRIGIVLIVLAVLVNPWAALATAAVAVLAVLIAYLTLGHDRAVEIIVAGHDRLARRNPAKAAGLRRRWARFAARLAAWLPGDMGAGLAPAPVADEMRDRLEADPFERLPARGAAGAPDQNRPLSAG